MLRFFSRKALSSIRSRIASTFEILQTRGSFGRNIAITFSGNTIVLFLGFILTPLMAKVYGPESYGQFAIFTSICSLIVPISTFQYPNGFVAVKNQIELYALIRISIFSVVCISVLSYTVLHIYLHFQNDTQTLDELVSFIPFYVLLSGLFIILRGINIKIQQFGPAARSKSIATIGGKATSIGIGTLISQSVLGLIFGNIVLIIIESVGLLSRKLRSILFHSVTFKLNNKSYRDALTNFKEYPTFVTINSIIHSIGSQIPVYFIAFYFSDSAVGLFSLSLALILTPLNLLGNSIATVFLPKISKLRSNQEERNRVVLELYKKLFYPSLIILVLIAVTLGQIMVPILGKEWADAGILVSFVSVSFSFSLVSLPLEVTYRIIGLERDNFKLNLIFILIKIIGISIGLYFNDFYITVFGYFFAELLKNSSQILLLFKRLLISFEFIFRDLCVAAIIYSLLFYLTKV